MILSDYTTSTTNLSAANESYYFSSVWSSLSSTIPDLMLLCYGSAGPKLVLVHKAILATQSTLLHQLFRHSTDPVLILPEVEVDTVNLMLDLLYSGRCNIMQTDWTELRKLLSNLEMLSLADGLQIIGKEVQEKIDEKTIIDDPGVGAFENGLDLEDSHDPLIPINKYFCQMCGKVEKSKFNLRVHYTLHHFFNDVSGLVSDKDCSTCELCGKRFEAVIQWNNFRNIVRHRGATHEEVMPFVRQNCGREAVDITCYDCKICDDIIEDMAAPVTESHVRYSKFGQHLVQEHFEEKLKRKISGEQNSCHLCDKKCKSVKMLAAHIGIVHGFAMKLYRKFLKKNTILNCDTQSSEKKPHFGIRKKCKFCRKFIAAAGTSWVVPLYSHYSSRHFSEPLLKDFMTDENACSVCGLKNFTRGKMVVHLGVKHRLVEKYLDAHSNESMQSDQLKIKIRRKIETKKQSETNNNASSSDDDEVKAVKMKKNNWQKFTCELCKKMMRCRADLQCHLAAIHFKNDVEEAMRVVFEKTGGVCPLCQDFQWTKESHKWVVCRHFARKHGVAENLVEMDGEVYQPNVQTILENIMRQDV